MMVGRLLSYWEGNFSGAMLNFRRVDVLFLMVNKKFHSPIPLKTGDKTDIKQSTVVKQSPSNAIRIKIIDGFIFVGCQKTQRQLKRWLPPKTLPVSIYGSPKKTNTDETKRNATAVSCQRPTVGRLSLSSKWRPRKALEEYSPTLVLGCRSPLEGCDCIILVNDRYDVTYEKKSPEKQKSSLSMLSPT